MGPHNLKVICSQDWWWVQLGRGGKDASFQFSDSGTCRDGGITGQRYLQAEPEHVWWEQW